MSDALLAILGTTTIITVGLIIITIIICDAILDIKTMEFENKKEGE